MKLRKKVMRPEIIECPFCGCAPSEGFDCVDHEDIAGDAFVRDAYQCPKCKKKSVRCYEFYAWENEDGDELERSKTPSNRLDEIAGARREMKKPYRYNKKDDIWQLVSICELCKREKCDFKTTHLTGCTDFMESCVE